MSKTGSMFTYAEPPLSGGCQFLSLSPTNEDIGLKVWLNMPQGPAPEDGWPVVIILDGESYFAPAAEMMQRLSRRSAKTRITPMMIVGVSSADAHDRVASYAFTNGPDNIQPLGHKLLDRLVADLIPLLVEQGANAKRITLAGHSMSALFVLETLTRDNPFFRYCAISPSLWWNDQIANKVVSVGPSDEQLMLAVGEMEQGINPEPSPIPRHMVSNLVDLAGQLGVTADVMRDEDHGSVAFCMMPKMLRFAARR